MIAFFAENFFKWFFGFFCSFSRKELPTQTKFTEVGKILDNDLVTENSEINKYFDMVIDIGSLEKEIKNLNIYKKAIYNSNFVDEAELVEILRPVTNSDSIWKSHSLFLLAEFFYFKENKAESKKLLNEIINYENSNSEIKLEAQKKLIRDFSE